ncbi:hypothetical protein AMTR_s00092p00147500 [Amborella trichopoda]|uniref:UDP-glucuronate decarboxylase n=1 Tax=Amborella trichopoda TaxID=13333 RepID=W1NX59_AMBTC|nr:hypothetical protein AMTR_s00092p00147500 [Amborella trichopoda]
MLDLVKIFGYPVSPCPLVYLDDTLSQFKDPNCRSQPPMIFRSTWNDSHLARQKIKSYCGLFIGSKDNLRKWIGHPKFELIHHDVTEPLLIEVDQIYHLSCSASLIFYKYSPVKTIKTNVIGTLNMLGLAKRVGTRILLTSTSEVIEHPQKGEYWGNVSPIEIRIARIFNTYGPRTNIDDGRVVNNFIVQALRDEPLTVQSPGTQTRSFCYVSDMVDGLIRLMAGDHTRPINLGNPGEFTRMELAETVKEGSVHFIMLRTIVLKDYCSSDEQLFKDLVAQFFMKLVE